jgi:hypothetical protein
MIKKASHQIENKLFEIKYSLSHQKLQIQKAIFTRKKETLEKANKSLSIWEEKIFDKEYIKIDKAQ